MDLKKITVDQILGGRLLRPLDSPLLRHTEQRVAVRRHLEMIEAHYYRPSKHSANLF